MAEARAKLPSCPFCGGAAEWREDHGVVGVPFGLVVQHASTCFLNFNGARFEKAEILAAWSARQPSVAAEKTAPGRMPEDRRDRFEARLLLARRTSQARTAEQTRIADRIEQMLYGTQSVEVADALVSLARLVLDEGKA